jgi:hypothetical protein
MSAAAAVFAGAVLLAPAHAQTLQHLTVTQFTLAADTNAPKLEEPFHLIVTVRVKQPVRDVENLDLPVLAELELLGDERRVTRDASGTAYREAIAVVAHHTGNIQIAPATLDAVDPRDKRAKRYFSNDLSLAVSGGVLEPLRGAGAFAGTLFRALLTLIFWILCAAAAIFVALTIFRRRRVPAPVQAPPIDPPIQRVRDPRDFLRDGLLTLRAEPTRHSAVQVRTLARSLVGASDTETLSDVLRRPSASDARMRDVLSSLERAAFTYDSDLPTAIRAAIISLEHALG